MYVCPSVGMLFSMASSLPSSVSGGAMVMGALGVTGKSPATTSTSNNNGNSGGDNREQVLVRVVMVMVTNSVPC